MLKGLGFLDESGVPTPRYFQFLDQGQSAAILAEAIREAYEDLFAVNKRANEMTVEEVRNKLRTLTQGQKSEKVVGLMANTFRALSDLADWDVKQTPKPIPDISLQKLPAQEPEEDEKTESLKSETKPIQLHYNIQIHLPESRDAAVFDAIFQALRKHLV